MAGLSIWGIHLRFSSSRISIRGWWSPQGYVLCRKPYSCIGPEIRAHSGESQRLLPRVTYVENGYCKHIASVCYVLVKTCETDPLPYLRGIGVDLQAMMGEYKRSPKLKRLRHTWAFSPTEPRRKVNRRLTPEDAGYSPEEPIIL